MQRTPMSKRLALKQDRKLTDFFTRRPSTSDSSQPKYSPLKLSQPSPGSSKVAHGLKITNAAHNQSTTPPNQETISISSNSHISVSSGSVAIVLDTPPPVKSRPRVAPFRDGAKPLTTDQRRTPNKRKKIFESDSDVEVLDTVIYIPKRSQSSPHANAPFPNQTKPVNRKANSKDRIRTSPSKKARRSVAVDHPAPEVVIRIPSSQSDEEELCMPETVKSDTGRVKESIEKWRTEAIGTPPRSQLVNSHNISDLDIDMAVYSPHTPEAALSPHHQSPFSEAEPLNPESVSTNPTSPSPKVSNANITPLSPPRLSEASEQPPTPLALDAETKTAQIIAQIKANAFAAAVSSPEEDKTIPEFKELEDSSDEELNIPDWQPKAAPIRECGPFSSPLTSVPSSPLIPASRFVANEFPDHPHRYNTRIRSKAAVTTTRPEVQLRVKDNGKGKKLSSDPFDQLLKEKKLVEKRMSAVRSHRMTASKKEYMRSEIDGEGADFDNHEENWTNNVAALANARKGFGIGHYSTSPSKSLSPNEDDILVKAEDQERLLGSERGKAVFGIFAKDREKNEAVGMKARAPGVPLWQESEAGGSNQTVNSNSLPRLFIDHESAKIDPILKQLICAIQLNDTPQITLLLSSGLLASRLKRHTSAVDWLCKLALSDVEQPLTESAFQLLLHIEGGISVSLILSTLWHLGADPTAFATIGRIDEFDAQGTSGDPEVRANVVYRLVLLLMASARADGFASEEVPNVLAILHLIAIDPSTSLDLRRELIATIDVVCESISNGTDIIPEIETNICNKLLNLTTHLTPVNKSFFVSFLAGGSSCTLRLARWLSYCLIVGENTMRAENYSNLPPIASLLGLLSSEVDGPFTIHGTTDYEDLGHYTDLLGIALSDVDGYVAEEGKAPLDESQNKKNGKGKQPLELIQYHLDRIHSEIVDTRAAHLDRSKTKAALQRLSMRIHYQRLSALSSRGKPCNLLDWMK